MAQELILIVEHDPAERWRMASALRRAGYQTLEADTGEAAVHLAEHHQPAAVLLELVLPGQDGWQVARRLKADPITCAASIVVISMLRRGAETPTCPIADYITKPYTEPRLLEAVRYAVWLWRFRTPPRVLIADDEPDTVDILSTVFRHEGFVTLEAKNGAEALDMTRREHPDVIILDVAMPRMDGWQALKTLKGDAHVCNIPVVMLTGVALSPHDAETALALGASRYVTKPFAADAIVHQVASVLQAA